MSLDPDDPRPPYLQIADALRATIADGTLPSGTKLPSGAELANQYGVSRMTVQNAVRVLRDAGLVVTRQGSGAFVRAGSNRANLRSPAAELEERIIYLVGRVAVTSSRLETLAAEAFAALLDNDAAELIAAGQNWATVYESCKTILNAMPTTSTTSQLSTAFKRANDAYQKRNSVIHGHWIAAVSGDTRTAVRPTRYGTPRTSRRTADQLDALVTELADAGTEIHRLTDALPRRLRTAATRSSDPK